MKRTLHPSEQIIRKPHHASAMAATATTAGQFIHPLGTSDHTHHHASHALHFQLAILGQPASCCDRA